MDRFAVARMRTVPAGSDLLTLPMRNRERFNCSTSSRVKNSPLTNCSFNWVTVLVPPAGYPGIVAGHNRTIFCMADLQGLRLRRCRHRSLILTSLPPLLADTAPSRHNPVDGQGNRDITEDQAGRSLALAASSDGSFLILPPGDMPADDRAGIAVKTLQQNGLRIPNTRLVDGQPRICSSGIIVHNDQGVYWAMSAVVRS